MGEILNTPAVARKLLFLQKYANKVLVTPQGIFSPTISIHFGTTSSSANPISISDATFGTRVRDLLDMVKHTSTFQINRGTLAYEYESGECRADGRAARISRRVELFDVDHYTGVEAPLLTLKLRVSGSIILSGDDTVVTYKRGKLVLETFGHIRTRMVVAADRVDGVDTLSVRVRGRDLRVVDDVEGEKVLCYHRNCLVIYGFDSGATTAAVIAQI